MKNLGRIEDPKDIITKEFLEGGIGARVNTLEDNLQMAESDIETLQTDVQGLQTDNTTTKAAVKTLQDTYVPNTRKVNGKALDADITLTASDVGAPIEEIDDNGYPIVKTADGNVIWNYSVGDDLPVLGQTPTNSANIGSWQLIYGQNGVNAEFGQYGIKLQNADSTTYVAVGSSESMGRNIVVQTPTNVVFSASKVYVNKDTSGSGGIITNLANPTNDTDATNKQYVDTAISSISIPVTSVNSKTGAVTLTASDVSAIPNTTPIPDIKVVTNVSCPLSAWVGDTTTYTDYQFKANLTVAGSTADYIPLVNFAPSEQESGNYIGATSGDGIVTIWCKSKPSGTITIPNIILTKEN